VGTREAEFAVGPLETRSFGVGLPLQSSASTEKANHSTGVPLFAKEQLFECTGPKWTNRHPFFRPVSRHFG